MYETETGQQVALSGDQIATLARIEQSFEVRKVTIRTLDGLLPDHEGMIAANTRVHKGGASGAAEWIIRGDGEILSRASAAAEPDEWLKEGQAAV